MAAPASLNQKNITLKKSKKNFVTEKQTIILCEKHFKSYLKRDSKKMVTGITMISQQQVINNKAMVLNGLTAAQIPSQEMPVKRATAASDARRVSLLKNFLNSLNIA